MFDIPEKNIKNPLNPIGNFFHILVFDLSWYIKALNSPNANFKLLRRKLFKCMNEVKTRVGVLFIYLLALRSSARIYYMKSKLEHYLHYIYLRYLYANYNKLIHIRDVKAHKMCNEPLKFTNWYMKPIKQMRSQKFSTVIGQLQSIDKRRSLDDTTLNLSSKQYRENSASGRSTLFNNTVTDDNGAITYITHKGMI